MALKQLNVFVENKRGSLVGITDALAKKNVDIRALSIADTESFGILRMIVSDIDLAREALSDLGCIVNISDVIGVKIGDTPGKLAQALAVLDDAEINLSICMPSSPVPSVTPTLCSGWPTTPPLRRS